ncbi:MAG: DUF6653 family protein, partial [Pseudomonadota bacterium]
PAPRPVVVDYGLVGPAGAPPPGGGGARAPQHAKDVNMPRNSFAERLMAMTDDVWERHANPWSGWSRLTIPPVFVAAVWSRVWLGWWSLVPIALVCLWTWLNPRVFRRPDSIDNWMSKGVLGERVWLARAQTPIPAHHRRMPHILAAVSGVGLIPLAWGLWALDPWPVLTGLALVMGGKLWFLDRMVWLFEETRALDAGS